MWSANSPNLNLVDYAMRAALQQQVYCDDCLKLWNSWYRQSWMSDVRWLMQKFIDCSINEWRRRLKCVVQQNGRHNIMNIFQNNFFSRRLHTAFLLQFEIMHICERYRFIDIFASSAFTRMQFYLMAAPPTVVQLNRVNVISDCLS